MKNDKEMIKKRGFYRQPLTRDPRITKAILLLATGCVTRKQLFEKGISRYAWDKKSNRETEKSYKSNPGYKGKLLEAKFIQEVKRGEYKFNWDRVLTYILSLVETDTDQNVSQFRAGISKLSERTKKLEISFEDTKTQYKKIGKEKKNFGIEKSQGYLTTHYFNNFQDFADKLSHTGRILREFRTFEDVIGNNRKELTNMIQIFLENTDNKNWLICQLILYFRGLLYSKEKFGSLEQEFKNFLYSIAYSKKTRTEFPVEMRRQYPFKYKKVDTKEFIKIASQYHLCASIKPEWLIFLKPIFEQETKKLCEEADRQAEQVALQEGKKRDEEFKKEFRKAKTVEEKYLVVYEYSGEKDAKNYLNREIIKEFKRKKEKLRKNRGQKRE